MEKPFIEIGLTLKNLRLLAGYKSYASFAWENQLDKTQYWRMENGTNFNLTSLNKVLKIHQLSFVEFFEMAEKSRSISTQKFP
jgi:hypothetical protein